MKLILVGLPKSSLLVCAHQSPQRQERWVKKITSELEETGWVSGCRPGCEGKSPNESNEKLHEEVNFTSCPAFPAVKLRVFELLI